MAGWQDTGAAPQPGSTIGRGVRVRARRAGVHTCCGKLKGPPGRRVYAWAVIAALCFAVEILGMLSGVSLFFPRVASFCAHPRVRQCTLCALAGAPACSAGWPERTPLRKPVH